jgi:ABC-type uncharacterized transport system substrate-binding protein
MRRRNAAFAVAVAGAIALAGGALAHPHVWIDNITTFQVAGGRIVAIKLRWTFDELFGGSIIAQYDRNKDKRFDAKEMEALKKGAFDNLQGYDYFTHLSVDDRKVPVKTVTGFVASIENGRLVYQFTVPVDPPVDPRKAKVVLGVYDAEFFVDIEIGGRESVRYEGLDGMDCRTTVAENPRHAIYNGQVYPLEMYLTCAAP